VGSPRWHNAYIRDEVLDRVAIAGRGFEVDVSFELLDPALPSNILLHLDHPALLSGKSISGFPKIAFEQAVTCLSPSSSAAASTTDLASRRHATSVTKTNATTTTTKTSKTSPGIVTAQPPSPRASVPESLGSRLPRIAPWGRRSGENVTIPVPTVTPAVAVASEARPDNPPKATAVGLGSLLDVSVPQPLLGSSAVYSSPASEPLATLPALGKPHWLSKPYSQYDYGEPPYSSSTGTSAKGGRGGGGGLFSKK
jgi:hypothetical protein